MFLPRHPFPIISVSSRPSIGSKPFCSVPHPVSYISISVNSFPDTLAIPHTFEPLSIVLFSIYPFVNPMPIRLPILEVASIFVVIRMHLIASPISHISLPAPLISSSICIYHNAFTFPFIFRINMSKIHSILIPFYLNYIGIISFFINS